MSANGLNRALEFTLRWEGEYVNDPDDRGGETNKGITHVVYDAFRKKKGLAKQSVRAITDQEVHEIYLTRYWNVAGCEGLAFPLDVAVFDVAVVCPPKAKTR